ncbi:hypothetical protein AB4Z54_25405, partial [Streptomyces sp. MCAF7]
KKADVERDATRRRADAEAEARRIVDEGKRELELLKRRQEDINAEISRVQDVLAALESFEAPTSGSSSGGNSGRNENGGVKTAAGAGTRASGKRSDG